MATLVVSSFVRRAAESRFFWNSTEYEFRSTLRYNEFVHYVLIQNHASKPHPLRSESHKPSSRSEGIGMHLPNNFPTDFETWIKYIRPSNWLHSGVSLPHRHPPTPPIPHRCIRAPPMYYCKIVQIIASPAHVVVLVILRVHVCVCVLMVDLVLSTAPIRWPFQRHRCGKQTHKRASTSIHVVRPSVYLYSAGYSASISAKSIHTYGEHACTHVCVWMPSIVCVCGNRGRRQSREYLRQHIHMRACGCALSRWRQHNRIVRLRWAG